MKKPWLRGRGAQPKTPGVEGTAPERRFPIPCGELGSLEGLGVWQGTQSLSVCLGVYEHGNVLNSVAPGQGNISLHRDGEQHD